jgi:hypothetical protein
LFTLRRDGSLRQIRDLHISQGTKLFSPVG